MGRRKRKTAHVTVPLNIPDVKVLKTEMNADRALVITVESLKKGQVAIGVLHG